MLPSNSIAFTTVATVCGTVMSNLPPNDFDTYYQKQTLSVYLPLQPAVSTLHAHSVYLGDPEIKIILCLGKHRVHKNRASVSA